MENLVACRNSQQEEIHGIVRHLDRHSAIVELYGPENHLRISESLDEFRISFEEQPIYLGRATVRQVVADNVATVCHVGLNEEDLNFELLGATFGNQEGMPCFKRFIEGWQGNYKALPEFKLIVTDLQSFLHELRLWLDRVELNASASSTDPIRFRQSFFAEHGERMVAAISSLHERFEEIADGIPVEARPVHRNLALRQLRPMFHCSPFGFRAFSKPLGYAGDYEMVNMIVRDPLEGGSLFAKLMNRWLLEQWPSRAHRNRIAYLKDRLQSEALRALRRGRPLRVLNIGCGPAREIQEFLTSELADHVEFTLLDFNDETIRYCEKVLGEARARNGRKTQWRMQKYSVQQLLKEACKTAVNEQYDYVYCAGLFDYLTDRVCRQLLGLSYRWLAPDGAVLATNVIDCKPFRNMLEFILDWYLIYRDTAQALALVPDEIPPEYARVMRDDTAVNLFIEFRKPTHG